MKGRKKSNSGIEDKRIKDYRKLAKRANVRIKALEDNNYTNYNVAKDYLDTIGRERFYEGSKFYSKQQLDIAIKEVNNFLKSDTTITGIKRKEHTLKDRHKYYNYAEIKKLNTEEKIKQAQRMANTSNRRLKELRQFGVDYYAIEKAEYYLQNNKRDIFYTGKKYDTITKLNEALRTMTEFLNSKTSTLKGVIDVRETRKQIFNEKFGIEFNTIDDERQFFEFLSDRQFDTLSRYGDSDNVLEDFVVALKQGFTKKQIMEQYQIFLDNNNEMTFEQINEMREKGMFFK